MKRSKPWFYAAVACAAIAALFWFGRRVAGGSAPVADAASSAARELVAPGRVEGTSDVVDLGFEHGGRIVAVLVDEGDRVEAEQVLARLDDRLARARVARAEAAVQGMRARRDAAFRGSLGAEIRAAEADADAARAQAANEAGERARAERLFSANAIPSAEAERIRAGAEATASRAAAADARLSLLREGTRGELKRVALAELAAAEAELSEARIALSQTELRAPLRGLVLRRRAEVGEQVSTLSPTVVISMANVDRLRLRAEVDEEDIGRVNVGQTGYARTDAYPGRRFPGSIVQVRREVGRTALLNDDPRARVDTRVLEVVFEFADQPALPLGLRMDLHLAPAAPRR